MIREISVRPKPSNNKAKISFIVFMALFVFGLVAYLIMRSMQVEKSGLIGFIPLVSITVAIFFYNKYLSGKYTYQVIFDSQGTPLFLITQTVGKRISTLCRVALSEIVRIEEESYEQMKAHKTESDHRRYVYLPTLMPAKVCRITARSRYERSEIVIECSEEFAGLLSEYATEAREMQRIIDEEEEF